MKINNKILIGLLIILIVIVSYLLIKQKPISEIFSEDNNIETKVDFKYDPNGPYPSPILDSVNMINKRGEVVDKFINGTFKKIGTNETFEYRERYDSNSGSLNDYNGNAVNDCVTKNCKIIYFIDQTNNVQGRVAIFNDKDNVAIGVISKISFNSNGKDVSVLPTPYKLGDKAVYTVIFTQNGKSGQVTISSEDLCMGNKGGGFSCHEPRYSKGDNVMFIHDISRGEEHVNGSLFNDKITEAELVSYQYSMSPDTGEVFPVITR